jgi:hypothetical protein
MRILSLLAVGAGLAFSQDPLRTLPKNYQLTFENEFVRVIRVHYGRHEKLSHDHPKTPTVYVYLSDAGRVKFKHTGEEAYARPSGSESWRFSTESRSA